MSRYHDVTISRSTEEKSCKVRYVHRACQDSKFAVLTVFATRMESIFWRYYELRETFNGGEEKFIKQQELQLIQCSLPETSKILARPHKKRECLVCRTWRDYDSTNKQDPSRCGRSKRFCMVPCPFGSSAIQNLIIIAQLMTLRDTLVYDSDNWFTY